MRSGHALRASSDRRCRRRYVNQVDRLGPWTRRSSSSRGATVATLRQKPSPRLNLSRTCCRVSKTAVSTLVSYEGRTLVPSWPTDPHLANHKDGFGKLAELHRRLLAKASDRSGYASRCARAADSCAGDRDDRA